MSHKLLIVAKLKVDTEFNEFLNHASVVRGEPFDVELTITNIGDKPFSGGVIDSFNLEYTEGVSVTFKKIRIGRIDKDKEFVHAEPFFGWIEGNAWLRLNIVADDKQSILYFHEEEAPPREEWSRPINIVNREKPF